MNKLFDRFITRIKIDRFFFVFVCSGGALAVAYFLEFALNLAPCSLCIWQRILYIALQCVALAGVYFSKWRRLIGILVILVGLAQITITIYHIGIEHYIFNESSLCLVSNNSCANVQFKFMNLSLAEWNLIYISAVLYYFIVNGRKNGFTTWRS